MQRERLFYPSRSMQGALGMRIILLSFLLLASSVAALCHNNPEGRRLIGHDSGMNIEAGSNDSMTGSMEDRILVQVRQKLPDGWTMRFEKDRLIIRRSEMVWVLIENRINSPVSRETDEVD